ncbi:MAG: hypothetical protein NC131_18615 [Roseburia sp.]|nr:hypothetical protein [Roseburia sp.]
MDKPEGFALQGRAANGVAASQPIATRTLAIQKDGTWYYAPALPAAQRAPSQVRSGLGVWLLKPHPAYGLDLPKNITEIYGTNGIVTASCNTTQSLQWSSESTDIDLGLVYYNYRHYNPLDGRWTGRDVIGEIGDYNIMSYVYVGGDVLGLLPTKFRFSSC